MYMSNNTAHQPRDKTSELSRLGRFLKSEDNYLYNFTSRTYINGNGANSSRGQRLGQTLRITERDDSGLFACAVVALKR